MKNLDDSAKTLDPFALIRLGLLLQGDDPRRISDDTFDHTLGSLWITAGKASY